MFLQIQEHCWDSRWPSSALFYCLFFLLFLSLFFSSLHSPLLTIQFGAVCLQVVGGKMTESGRLCAFITKVKKGSLADTVGHLRPGKHTAFPDRS